MRRRLFDSERPFSHLMRFLQPDLDAALTLDPQARHQAGRWLVRLIAGTRSPWAR
jgi:hypothetical protein